MTLGKTRFKVGIVMAKSRKKQEQRFNKWVNKLKKVESLQEFLYSLDEGNN